MDDLTPIRYIEVPVTGISFNPRTAREVMARIGERGGANCDVVAARWLTGGRGQVYTKSLYLTISCNISDDDLMLLILSGYGTEAEDFDTEEKLYLSPPM